ncbi:MAG: PLP-dependent aminotransferase family protein, partial [Thiolinea sp.]
MREHLFHLDPDSSKTLQSQIRELMVTAILDGYIPAGEKVPSPRKLSQELKVARNTVMEAYSHLVDDGYLEARERSGYFVSELLRDSKATLLVSNTAQQSSSDTSGPDWAQRLGVSLSTQRNIVKPQDWKSYTYPFISGQIDLALFPSSEWRDCSRYTHNNAAIQSWATDHFDADTPALVEQLRTRVLPQRGVRATENEILITLGAQHALYLLGRLLMQDKCIGIEEPGYPDARNIFSLKASSMRGLPVDEQGLIVDDNLADCDYVYVTPSHQAPTTVTMSLERRKALLDAAEKYNFIIIEDDYEGEINYLGTPSPSLWSLDTRGRVIYVGSLSKTLAPGLRLGYLVAAPELIREARALRRLMLRHAPGNNESIIALFLSRGHHDVFVRRLHRVYRERWQLLQEVLQRHLPDTSLPPTFGGTAYWVEGPEGLDCRQLQQLAAEHSILIEPGDV